MYSIEYIKSNKNLLNKHFIENVIYEYEIIEIKLTPDPNMVGFMIKKQIYDYKPIIYYIEHQYNVILKIIRNEKLKKLLNK